jgi:hypothetical protein
MNKVTDDMFRDAKEMETRALTELIRQDLAGITNGTAVGTCEIYDSKVTVHNNAAEYSIQIPVPRFGDSVHSYKIRIPKNVQLIVARNTRCPDYGTSKLVWHTYCHITPCLANTNGSVNTHEYLAVAYQPVFVIGSEMVTLELGFKQELDTHKIIPVQVVAEYIFYNNEERSCRLNSNNLFSSKSSS